MKIFVLGLLHTQSTLEFNTCAFTSAIRNLCRMMHERGHEVIHLGVEGSDPDCTEHVSVVSLAEWSKVYGHPGSGWYDTQIVDDSHKRLRDIYVRNASEAIRQRAPAPWESIVCVTWGDGQRDVASHASGVLHQHVVESGIGYRHTYARNRVFVSYAWMHTVHGYQDRSNQAGGHWYDVVIPYAVDPSLFDYREKKQDYFLFLGRLVNDKGVHLACELAERTGIRLVIAGQGDPSRFLKNQSHVEYHPPADVATRRELLAGARGFLCPTIYNEPFGAVAVEAQLSGTPVICTDWGGFTETVLHGVTGYRCRTMEHFEWAVRNIEKLRPRDCRAWSLDNYRLEKISPMYEEYFQSVLNQSERGWYAKNEARTELDWLSKKYPPSACRQEGHLQIDFSTSSS